MPDLNPYKTAYERERKARVLAEKLLDEKTRTLYDKCQELEETLNSLEQMQEHLIQSEKMASIGQLAAGVAHEINNPVGYALCNLSILQEYIQAFIKLDTHMKNQPSSDKNHSYHTLRDSEDIDYIIEDIAPLMEGTLKGLHRIDDIVSNLKKVSHGGELTKKKCNVNSLIDESLKVVWNQIKYSMAIKKDFSDLPLLNCHESKIHQVLINMFVNASHACGTEGALLVKTTLECMNEEQFIVIEITDNGKGMSKVTLMKIFDPFFTTKPVGVGTGLGLSISFGIITKHGGNIQVKSKEGKGTSFFIHLPV